MSRDPIGYAGSRFNVLEYAASSPLDRTDAIGRDSVQYCDEAVKKAISLVAPSENAMKKRGCSLPTVLCTTCGSHSKECNGRYGAFYPDRNTLYICAQPSRSSQSYRDTLIHEYKHAYDVCFGADFDDCRDLACSEIQAFVVTGQCDVGGAHRLPNETMEQCVRRSVLKTMRGCTVSDINAVFDLCFYFAEPLPPTPPPEEFGDFILRKCLDSCIDSFRRGELDPEDVDECIAKCESEYGAK